MDAIILGNGYEYVDFGLPSGTLWATHNVGASNPSDYGQYFQWGDTVGYTKDQVGKDKKFYWDDYKFSISGSEKYFSKYTTPGATLDLEDDAAHVYMGGDWHMPSPTQFTELATNTTSEWTKLDGINGLTFTSKKDMSISIFFPVNSFAWDGLVHNTLIYCLLWSSMKSSIRACYGKNISFTSRGIFLGESGRSYGFPVRGVIG